MDSLPDTKDWLICTACGTQFGSGKPRRTCFICDDPRQFTPPSGQAFTTLGDMVSSSSSSSSSSPDRYRNVLQPYDGDDRLTFIYTTPKFAIGQRAVLVRTGAGNILWDCVTLLDEATVAAVRALGGIQAMVISHPHYYTTHLLWARAFGCDVYLAREDDKWLTQTQFGASSSSPRQLFLPRDRTEWEITIPNPAGEQIRSGARVLKLGGHFPGSLVLLFDGRLMVADTLVTTPAGLGGWETDALGNRRQGHLGRPEGTNTFAFMWSIPNMIPLSPDIISTMWDVLKKYKFTSTHGAFVGTDIEDVAIKERVLESMQIQIRGMGHPNHPFLDLYLD